MPYLQYLRNILWSFLACCLIFILVVLYQIGTDTKNSSFLRSVDKVKFDYANSIHTPKLVITAGSNALWGISSKMITEETSIPSVNAAVYAGLGIDYILHHVRPLLKTGDTVLLPLEYDLYLPNVISSNPEAVNTLIDYILAHDPIYLLTHPQLIVKLPFKRLVEGLSAKFKPIPAKASPDWINISGDAINNLEINLTEKERTLVNNVQPIGVQNLKNNTSEFRAIKKFADWCKKQKIRIIATWPNTIWFEIYNQPHYQKFFHDIETFYKNIQVPLIGKYREFMYDKSMFFNSSYHLNDRGVRHRTRQLIELLRLFSSTTSSSSQGISSKEGIAPLNFREKIFSQEIQLLKPLKSAKVNELIKLPVRVKNTSNFVWDTKDINPVNFAYHWLDNHGKVVVFNSIRTVLPERLDPQSSLQLNAVIKLPDRPGNYNLILTMVQENIVWFNDKGAQSLKIPVTVNSP